MNFNIITQYMPITYMGLISKQASPPASARRSSVVSCSWFKRIAKKAAKEDLIVQVGLGDAPLFSGEGCAALLSYFWALATWQDQKATLFSVLIDQCRFVS